MTGATDGGFGSEDPASNRVAVVGSTAWGTTLAILLARNGRSVVLLVRDADEQATLDGVRKNVRRLPGADFPRELEVSADPAALQDAALICFAVPSLSFLANVEAVAAHVSDGATLLTATKGIDAESGRRMSQLLAGALPGRPVVALSGPNLSRELASGLPGSTVIASADAQLDAVRSAFHSDGLRVYSSVDIIGVELGGALKNVIAIAAGMVDAFDYGDNAKAAIVTRGLAEITRLGVAAGADPLTFQGLAGIGDLVATAYSPLSRNRRLGELIVGGASLEEALATLGATAEGASTVPSALRLAKRLGVEMPITAGLDGIMFHGVSPRSAVAALMEREPKTELATSSRGGNADA